MNSLASPFQAWRNIVIAMRPCPCCGGVAARYNRGRVFLVGCTRCGLEVSWSEDPTISARYNNELDAVRAWNARSNEDGCTDCDGVRCGACAERNVQPADAGGAPADTGVVP